MKGEYLTVSDMAQKLGESTDTVKKRLFRLNIKPLSKDALYEKSVLEALKKTPGKGRPPKKPAASETASISRKKPGKKLAPEKQDKTKK